MALTSTEALDYLSALRAPPDTSALVIAYSGGPDSTALLALAHAARDALPALRALHVNHGLHPQAANWEAQCRDVCAQLNVPFDARRVATASASETDARRARYEAFEASLNEGEVLALAHHRDDALETTMLNWLRGTGPRGLAGMPRNRPLGRGRLVRPVLDLPRQVLLDVVRRSGLPTIQDPANQSLDHARNRLRAMLAGLDPHFPGWRDAAARSLELMGEQNALLDALLDPMLEARLDAAALRLEAEDTPALRAALLRRWLQRLALKPPPASKLREFTRQLDEARGETAPRLAHSDWSMQAYRDRVYLCLGQALQGELLWQGQSLSLPGGCLRWRGDAASAPRLTVRARQGGERLRLAGRRHSSSVKKLLQDAGMPPLLRERLPLIYRDETLVAVGDRWLSEAFAAELAGLGLCYDYTPSAVLDPAGHPL